MTSITGAVKYLRSMTLHGVEVDCKILIANEILVFSFQN